MLLYADDRVAFSKKERNSQNLLNIVSFWCSEWRLAINSRATIFFRKYTASYNYLGFSMRVWAFQRKKTISRVSRDSVRVCDEENEIVFWPWFFTIFITWVQFYVQLQEFEVLRMFLTVTPSRVEPRGAFWGLSGRMRGRPSVSQSNTSFKTSISTVIG